MWASGNERVRSQANLMDSQESDLRRLSRLAQTQLKNPAEGKILFSSGVKNNWKWRPMCCSNQNFRAYFTIELYRVRADLVSKALTTAVEERFVKRKFFKNLDMVVSLGCGAGAELYGLKGYLHEAFPFSSRRRNLPNFIGYDTELGWMPYVEDMGFEFCELRNSKISKKLLEDMDPVDVILIPLSLKRTQQTDDSLGEINILDIVIKKAKFVMFFDVDDGSHSTALAVKGFRHFTVTDLLGTDVHVYCFLQSL